MQYLIQQATILDIYSPHHLQTCDILIEDGVIISLTNNIPKIPSQAKIIKGNELYISVGWFDMRASFKEPGFEHKETIATGSKSALLGGFTGVALLPNTQPIIQNKNDLSFILNKNAHQLLQLYPVAALTSDTAGEELTEMYDLHTHGAVAFSDGEKAVTNIDILLKSLQYLQQFGGLLINQAEEKRLTHYGQMHEGIVSTLLGMKAMPAFAEELMVRNLIDLLTFAGGKLHISTISTAKSVALIREAKAQGLALTCDVAVHQLIFEDKDLMDFDTNFKVNPPFRTENDRKALWQGLTDGTIDVIVSDHNPQDIESKRLEFDLAEFGILGLQTFFSALCTHKPDAMSWATLIEKFTYNPRKILQLPLPILAEGQMANLTVFDLVQEWLVTESKMASISKNSPFVGRTLKGKPIAVANNYHFFICDEL